MTRLIDKDMLIEQLKELQEAYNPLKYHSPEIAGSVNVAKGALWMTTNMIEAMPTVDAVPVVHGHWVEHEELLWGENTSAPYYKCSECGYDTRHDTPYCPMCGARTASIGAER